MVTESPRGLESLDDPWRYQCSKSRQMHERYRQDYSTAIAESQDRSPAQSLNITKPVVVITEREPMEAAHHP